MTAHDDTLTEFRHLGAAIHRFRCTNPECGHHDDPTYFTPRDNDAASAVYRSDWLAARDAAQRAEAWDEGYTSGHSNAMRRMSDEPDAPTTPNPYRANRGETADERGSES